MARVACACWLCWLAVTVGCSGSLQKDGLGPRPDGFVLTVDAAVTDAPIATDVAGVADATGAPGFDAPGLSMNQRSFVVTSTLTAATDGDALPPVLATHSFTLVLDVDARIAIAGGGAVPTEPASGGAVRTRGVMSFDVVGCAGIIQYEQLVVSIAADGTLTGTGLGQAVHYVGGMGTLFRVTTSLTGVADTDAPVLMPANNADTSDPFALDWVMTSEPLPPGARAILVAAQGGQQFVLNPLMNGNGTAVLGFQFPATLLHYDEVYRLTYDGIVDFAGNPARTPVLRFAMRDAPPLLPEDGFESASTTFISLAGSAVQPLFGSGPTITGRNSIYVRSGAAVAPGRSTQLALRLGLVRGDSVVRFTYRMVNPNSFPSTMYAIAGVDGQISWIRPAIDTGPLTPATMPGQGEVMLGQPATAELPLPAGAAGQIVFARVVTGATCPLAPPPPVPGIIIDDLRVE